MPFYQGSPVPLIFLLTDENGNPVNTNGTVTITVTLPDLTTAVFTGTPTSAQISNPVTGTYQVAGTGYTTTQSGHHTWTGTATGNNPGGYTDDFDVWPLSEGAVLSLADAKRTLRIAASDTSEDDFVREFNEAVTEVIEWYCGPVLVQTVVEELRVGGLTVPLSKPPVMSLVTWTSVPPEIATDPARTVSQANSGPMFPVMVWGVAYPLAQLHVNKTRGEVRHTSGLPFYYGPYLWQYQAGRPVVPMCLTNAARAILRHLYEMERGGQGGTAIGQADTGTTMTPFGFSIPNRALEMMAPEMLAGVIA